MESRTPNSSYLTVKETAQELGMTTWGVYKLIKRGQLGAFKKSARQTLIPRPALANYQARIAGEGPSMQMPHFEGDPKRARDEFEKETGQSPSDWIGAWKRDEIEDSPENMRRTILALSLQAELAHSVEHRQPVHG